MADIATVIRKTIDGLPVNSPAIRQKVYERARSAILSKLEGRDPRPAQEAIDKQMKDADEFVDQLKAATGPGPLERRLRGMDSGSYPVSS